jgi:hypothetical protein
VNGQVAYRTLMAGFSFILFYNVAIGLYQGSDVLWLYVYPLVAFFMFGIVEGFVWIIALMGLTFITILFPDLLNSHPFSPAYKVRLILSLAVVTLVACLLESLRAHFFEQLRRQKIKLENALQDIKALQGLVPVCSLCKKIKDDQGYWQAVDDYLASHADVQISHGLCEECLKESEPEIYRSLVARGKIKRASD